MLVLIHSFSAEILLHFTIFKILFGYRCVLAGENAKFPFRYIRFNSGNLPCFPLFLSLFFQK